MHLNVHLRYLSVTQVKEVGVEEDNGEEMDEEIEDSEAAAEEVEKAIESLPQRYEMLWPVGGQQWAVDAVLECDPDWWKFFCVSCSANAAAKVIINM